MCGRSLSSFVQHHARPAAVCVAVGYFIGTYSGAYFDCADATIVVDGPSNDSYSLSSEGLSRDIFDACVGYKLVVADAVMHVRAELDQINGMYRGNPSWFDDVGSLCGIDAAGYTRDQRESSVIYIVMSYTGLITFVVGWHVYELVTCVQWRRMSTNIYL
jgi:hypothetical protein